MKDDKRLVRQLKKIVKKDGNKKRRNFLKNVRNNAEDFEFGLKSTKFMNSYDYSE
jgi:hypothetical protein